MSAARPPVPRLVVAWPRREAARLGLWVFLATEIMFFGPLFLGYAYGRLQFAAAFAAASRATDILAGTLNTALLLTSSLLMAEALAALELGRRRAARGLLGGVAALGLAFLAIKGLEYRHEWARHLVPGAGSALPTGGQLFFLLYYTLTGFHALHLGFGIALVLGFALALRGDAGAFATPERLRLVGLYWHFVDVVWIFLYPLLYLVGRAA